MHQAHTIYVDIRVCTWECILVFVYICVCINMCTGLVYRPTLFQVKVEGQTRVWEGIVLCLGVRGAGLGVLFESGMGPLERRVCSKQV